MAIRDKPLAALSVGINNSMYKALTFGVSALYTGVSGALGAIVAQFVAPDSFTIYLSVALLVGLVIAGVGWLPGAFFGAANELSNDIARHNLIAADDFRAPRDGRAWHVGRIEAFQPFGGAVPGYILRHLVAFPTPDTRACS